MSRLQQTNNGVIDNAISKQLEVWVNNPPEYDVMVETYKTQGRIKAAITRLKRDIERVEDQVSIEVDKPRSNEAKKAKLEATSELKDQLSELESQLAIVDADVKILEFVKTMFSSANYRMKMTEGFV